MAVLGILTINIASFAAGEAAVLSPDAPDPGSAADRLAFAVNLVLFEGKMRALFSLLFGASLLLFVERADAAGRDGTALQLRRLVWLMVFGFVHFALLWDGDILFVYGAIGLAALGFRRSQASHKLIAAGLALALWQAFSSAAWIAPLTNESAVAADTASPAAAQQHGQIIAQYRQQEASRSAEVAASWPDEVAARMTDRPAYPLTLAFNNWGESLSFMLLGMALLQAGFFSGGTARQVLRRIAIGGLLLGGGASLGFALWAGARGYPELAMRYWTGYGLAFARAAMALGYAAVLVLAAPRLLNTALGQRLEAAGRMAFSNYIATSLIMTGIFHGWGLGLYGQYGAAARWLFVVGVWALMLAWSPWWLRRFRHGPLEWLWRSLGAGQIQPFSRR